MTDISQRDSTLPTPDPPASSKTTGLVNQQLPYMVPTYVRPPPMFEKGEGCYMWDVENRRYLDFTAGIAVNALGHCDAGVAQVIGEQVLHTSILRACSRLTQYRPSNSCTLPTSTTTRTQVFCRSNSFSSRTRPVVSPAQPAHSSAIVVPKRMRLP